MILSDNKYTDLISRFDNWYDFKAIGQTLKHIGLEFNLTPDEYVAEIDFLKRAAVTYPQLPLNEAYVELKADPSKAASIYVNEAQKNIAHAVFDEAVKRPCGSCGGGKVL